jgi:hypothetical protein
MLFLVTYSYEPDKRNEVLQRRTEQGAGFASGAKVIGEWSHLGGGGGLVIAEADDPLAVAQTARGWSDLVKFTIVPVVDTEQMMKLAK